MSPIKMLQSAEVLSMLKQIRNNLRSKTDYKDIHYDLFTDLVQGHCTSLAKYPVYLVLAKYGQVESIWS